MRSSFGVWENLLLIFLIFSLVGSGLQVSLFSRKLSKDFASQRTIVLQTRDGGLFEVEAAAALQSQTIKHMVEDSCADTVPLPNVTSKILAKVIDYCKHHVEAGDQDQLKKFDADFVRVDQETLFELILAADYLQIKSLLDLASQTVADMIKGKTPGEIRKMFNIRDCFTPEEEEFVRENKWAFE